jgi:hypothetical protein
MANTSNRPSAFEDKYFNCKWLKEKGRPFEPAHLKKQFEL